jgi:hypothetical protein
MTMIADDIDSFDDIYVLQTGTDAEFSSNFVLVLTLGFAGTSWAKLLYSIDGTSCFSSCTNKANGATRARAEDTAPLAILF